MQRRGDFSVDPKDGRIAIVSSAVKRIEREVLAEEVEMISDVYGTESDIQALDRPSVDQFLALFQNRRVASVVILGHGSFSSVRIYSQYTKGHRSVGWYDLADAATHLKLGFFEQRTCGLAEDVLTEMRLSLGCFVVSDQTKIAVPVNKAFSQIAGYEDIQPSMKAPYEKPNNSIEELRALHLFAGSQD